MMMTMMMMSNSGLVRSFGGKLLYIVKVMQ